ncbi:odorant receptor 13a-like [Fopius arisanus]|uniref:Odorant receptor n=1 Tax=Fopius arisanus TaxID=64838 RepID=A0A9R1TE58_9HYME|nr:PREDICTED: odorant receptor 13a-like [Fopius arisanus]
MCAFFPIGIFILTFIASVIPCVMFASIKMKTMSDRLVFLGPLGFHVTNSLKYILIIYHSDVMKKCVTQVTADWMEAQTNEEQNVMWKSANLGRSLTRMCAFFMFSGAIFFQAMTMLKPKEIDKFNVTIRQHVLPRYDYFVDSQMSPVFEITYGTHTILLVFLYTIEIAICNLAAVFVSHICGQVRVMKLKLKRLEESACERSNDLDDAIWSVIHCHVKILKLIENTRNGLWEICLIEVTYSAIVMCWLEFYCLREWSNSDSLALVTYASLFISLTFNIFTLCLIGEVAKNECSSVAELTYNIAWYHIPPKQLTSFILIIAMARYSRNLSAGGMVEMTLQSFATVLKTSFMYFQMLRTVTG